MKALNSIVGTINSTFNTVMQSIASLFGYLGVNITADNKILRMTVTIVLMGILVSVVRLFVNSGGGKPSKLFLMMIEKIGIFMVLGVIVIAVLSFLPEIEQFFMGVVNSLNAALE